MRWNKGIAGILVGLALSGAMAMSVSAVDENSTAAEENTEIVSENSETDTVITDVLQEALDSVTESSGEDYYGNSYYDTQGNATLIKEEDIIYDSEEMQFIAVTTKDGSVFYVLINYTADNQEENVYFLNKVDDYDLYALLYAGNDSESAVDPAAAASEAANRANGESTSDNSAVTTTISGSTNTTVQTQSSNSGSTNLMLLGIGVVVLAGAGFAFYKFKSGGKGGFKKSKNKNEDSDSFDEADDFDSLTVGESEDDE